MNSNNTATPEVEVDDLMAALEELVVCAQGGNQTDQVAAARAIIWGE